MWLLLTATKKQIVESLLNFFSLFLTARRKVLEQSKLPGYLVRKKQVFSLFADVGSFFFSFIYFIGFYMLVTLWHDELPADVSIFVTAFRFNDTQIFCVLKHINHSKRHKEQMRLYQLFFCIFHAE